MLVEVEVEEPEFHLKATVLGRMSILQVASQVPFTNQMLSRLSSWPDLKIPFIAGRSDRILHAHFSL